MFNAHTPPSKRHFTCCRGLSIAKACPLVECNMHKVKNGQIARVCVCASTEKNKTVYEKLVSKDFRTYVA